MSKTQELSQGTFLHGMDINNFCQSFVMAFDFCISFNGNGNFCNGSLDEVNELTLVTSLWYWIRL